MRLFVSGMVITLLVAGLLAGCGGGEGSSGGAPGESESPQEKAEETTAPPGPFEGEHLDLASDETAVWREGLEMTVANVHLAPNQNRASAEKSREAQEKRGKEAKKGPAEQAAENLVAFEFTVANNGEIPVRFNGGLPCEGLDPNGISVPPAGGIAAEQSETARTRPLEQPLEPGQTRTGIYSMAPPTEGTEFEIVCAHPPQQGGKPNIAQIPEQGRASWSIDTSELEFRDQGNP